MLDNTYKKYAYTMIRRMKQILNEMECDRCPSKFMGRNCCYGCHMMKSKIQQYKKEMNGMRNGEEEKILAAIEEN